MNKFKRKPILYYTNVEKKKYFFVSVNFSLPLYIFKSIMTKQPITGYFLQQHAQTKAEISP